VLSEPKSDFARAITAMGKTLLPTASRKQGEPGKRRLTLGRS
jgi:hypothetical protein